MAVDYKTLKKGGFMRQKQKNNFSLRLRVVGGTVTAQQLAKIAEVSEKFGEGYVHLTSRQGVGDLLTGYLLTYDALKMEFRKIKLPSDTSGCDVCGEHPTITKLIDYEQAVCEGI